MFHPTVHQSPLSQVLKECADEMDLGTQYHLSRYAFLLESVLLGDGSTLVPTGPEDGTYLSSVRGNNSNS